MSVRLEVEWQIAETAVEHGARIALRAELVLATVEVHLFLRSRGSKPGDSGRSMPLRVSLFPPGTRALRHEKRMVHATGTSRLALRVTDAAGRPLSEEIAVGRRDGAKRHAELSFWAPVELSAWVTPSAGPTPDQALLSVRGELNFPSGLALQWSAQPAPGAPAESVSAPPRIQLAGPGATVHARERTFENTCPTEAWVSAAFVDGSGNALSERSLLGLYQLP